MPTNTIAAISYSGPLPHPEQFQQYNLVVPGAAERILTMTEKQQSHRMMMETIYMQSQIKQTYIGQLCAFSIAMTGLLGSVYLSVMGEAEVAAIIAVLDIGSMVYIFIKGRESQILEAQHT